MTDLFKDSQEFENEAFLTTQIITYLGNKRSLIGEIEKQIILAKEKLKKEKCICVDLFSGSGIVARMLKRHSSTLIVNDLENYSCVINSCYLTNKTSFSKNIYQQYKRQIDRDFEGNKIEGIITKYYSPKNDYQIQKGERVFYTHENATRIDTYRKLINKIETEYQKFFLAPLITEASIHVNTSGVFKGFYKDANTGIGCFGGTGKNALSRIMEKITLPEPIFSNYECDIIQFQEDAVTLANKLKSCDIVYLDPPYNQHPYGSNYFMLNTIINNQISSDISKISGIPNDWNRSVFNKKGFALQSMEKIVKNLDTRFFIISYNSEGFITYDEMCQMLSKYGKLTIKEIVYNTFRGSRNLRQRASHVLEYLFILEK